jgi:hypothetical protein
MEARVRKALASVDPNLVLYGVDPYAKVVSADFQQEDMIATLTTLFGVLGLVLAAVGLYGVLAYMVERRTGEIGMRMALGADRGRVIGMVLGNAFWQVGIRFALGIPAVLGAGTMMTAQLFGVMTWDPVLLTLATLLLGSVALLASAIPAWRAAVLLAGDHCDGRWAVPKNRRASIVSPKSPLRWNRDLAGVFRVFHHCTPGRHGLCPGG